MKTLRVATLVAVSSLCLLVADIARAAPVLLVDGGGKLTGATGVMVGSSFFDVSFVDGTCIALFNDCDASTDFVFQSQDEATAASQALLDQVFIDGPSGLFDSDPIITQGCFEDPLSPLACGALTPFGLAGTAVPFVLAMSAYNALFDTPADQVVGPLGHARSTSTAPTFDEVYAVWTPAASVPEPATVTLVALGAVGLGFARRRQRT